MTPRKKAAPKKSAPVLLLRTCEADGGSYGGFKWPLTVGAEVSCPDWNPVAECGNGLHGLINGQGDWSLVPITPGRKIIVFEAVGTVVKLSNGTKAKCAKAIVRWAGESKDWAQALGFIWATNNAKPEASATGDSGHASATGYSGHASATGDSGHASATGYYGHASATGCSGHASATGYYGHASATGCSGHASATGCSGHASATGDSGHASATGDSGHASATGDSGHASATGGYGHASATGYYGHASATGCSGHASATGYYGHASATGYSGHASATGDYGYASATGYSGIGVALGKHYNERLCAKARAGATGAIVLVDWSGKRPRIVTGYPGEDGIKADTWYRVEAGKLVECVE